MNVEAASEVEQRPDHLELTVHRLQPSLVCPFLRFDSVYDSRKSREPGPDPLDALGNLPFGGGKIVVDGIVFERCVVS